jgi:hypothetical protein
MNSRCFWFPDIFKDFSPLQASNGHVAPGPVNFPQFRGKKENHDSGGYYQKSYTEGM